MKVKTPPERLSDLPLWRLLVALSDAERTLGPTDPTTRSIANAVQNRLKEEQPENVKPWLGGNLAAGR
jgi:hypothetical protein